MTDLVDTAWLAAHLGAPDLVVADVRWQHGQPDFGREAFAAARIPGAVRISLDHDLSGPTDPPRGRHPLPDPRDLVAALARAGIGAGTRVVAYDDSSGSVAVRLWWLLRWLGQPGTAGLLDGGIAKWTAEGRAVEGGPAPARRRTRGRSRPACATS